MATPMMRTQFRSIVEPVMNEVFDNEYAHRKDEHKAIFETVQGIARAYHEDVVKFSFGSAPELPDGAAISYDAGGILFEKRYVYKVYGMAYAMTETLIEDSEHETLAPGFARGLARSLAETKETLTANVLNRAFSGSYVGGDGVSLVNSAHPIRGGQTYSNVLATPANLSQTSLEQMLIDVRNAVDDTGKKMNLRPEKLVVAPANMMQAEVLLNSTLRTGTANNDVNPVKSMGLLRDIVVLSRMTNDNAWWIKTDAREGLKVVMRRGVKRGMEGDFETSSMRYKATERYSVGFTNPRAVYGSAGV